ncbi:hypothetical protein BD413DRAFT_28908 [Trametes elegans]|nr:hypothetical protein BD413DRAFT_28908 [Trametes elegans]
MNGPLTATERALAQSMAPEDVRDVRFFAFSRKSVSSSGELTIHHPLPIVAIGSLLKQTEHFSNMLTVGFAESAASDPRVHEFPHRQAKECEYDFESDSDLDDTDAVEGLGSPNPSAGPTQEQPSEHESKHNVANDEYNEASTVKAHTVLIPNMAYKTVRGCVFYLYTGKVHCLPLSSEESGLRAVELVAAQKMGVPACSPKSLYRLADSVCPLVDALMWQLGFSGVQYGMRSLQEITGKIVISRLTARNVVQETFSSFFSLYDDLRHQATEKLRTKYENKQVQEAIPMVIKKLAAGELPHAAAAMQELVCISAERTMWINSPRTVPPSMTNAGDVVGDGQTSAPPGFAFGTVQDGSRTRDPYLFHPNVHLFRPRFSPISRPAMGAPAGHRG